MLSALRLPPYLGLESIRGGRMLELCSCNPGSSLRDTCISHSVSPDKTRATLVPWLCPSDPVESSLGFRP